MHIGIVGARHLPVLLLKMSRDCPEFPANVKTRDRPAVRRRFS
jgi:hypothetical protein